MDSVELGDGTLTDSTAPVRVAGVEDATGVAVGDSHASALLETGAVVCWGVRKEIPGGEIRPVPSATGPVDSVVMPTPIPAPSGSSHPDGSVPVISAPAPVPGPVEGFEL